MIELVVGPGALLGECPLWSVTEDALYRIDIDGQRIHRLDPGSGRRAHRHLPGRPGSIALTADPGRLLMAIEHELALFEWEPGRVEPWLELEPASTGNRLNDGRVGPGGRFWVGSMFERPVERRTTGMLHRVDPDRTVTTHRREVGVFRAAERSLPAIDVGGGGLAEPCFTRADGSRPLAAEELGDGAGS